MSWQIYLVLILGALSAATGQMMLKHGATGRDSLLAFVNIWIVGGIAVYAAGAVFWIIALSRAQLMSVYPFTALTFAFVFIGAAALFGERLSPVGSLGIGLILGRGNCRN